MPVPVSPNAPLPPQLSGGAHVIAAAPTSIAAFVGRSARGPVNAPVRIESFAQFEQFFGGLWAGSCLGYAVNDFFRNGGSTAVIVRLAPDDAAPAALALPGGPPTLLAVSPGAWGNALAAVVDSSVSAAAAAAFGLQLTDLFNLRVLDSATGAIEGYENLSVKDSPRRIDKVLAAESTLVRVAGALTAVPLANAAPALGKTVWSDPNAHTAATPGSGSDGGDIALNDFVGPGFAAAHRGLYALDNVDLFNLLCIPPYAGVGLSDVDFELLVAAAAYCEKRRAFLIVDPPSHWTSVAEARAGVASFSPLGASAALFFPRILEHDPLENGAHETFAPSGAVVGVIARTDAERGVWKAPAGLDATLFGASGLSLNVGDVETGELDAVGINVLRSFSTAGILIWGARTLHGDNGSASPWKYIPVRRLALFIEESLYRGLQWVVFEPNGAPLWAQIRLSVGDFLHTLFVQGAFQGDRPDDAYFVRCDASTITQSDIDAGVVNVVVGFAPLRPAEFVIFEIQQFAGQTGG